jgi:RNA polymerase I-specific transcription initiation factor RRN3
LIFNVELDADAREASTSAVVAEQQADMVEKLDVMMGHTFEYLRELCSTPVQTQAMFRILLKVFDRAILLTHRSKYTQFLLFYICHLDLSFSAQYVGYLLKTGIEGTQHTATRQAALAYAGSFLARASYVPSNVVRSIVKAMLDWALAYIERNPLPPNSAIPAQPQQHVVFYSVCQAVFYTCCFRFADIVEATNPLSLASHGVGAIITCALNPFKVSTKTR